MKSSWVDWSVCSMVVCSSSSLGLGEITGMRGMSRVSKGTCSFAGLLECGGLSLGGGLVVCLGAIVFCGDSVLNATNSRSSETDLDSDTSVLAVVLGLGRGRRVRCTLGAGGRNFLLISCFWF